MLEVKNPSTPAAMPDKTVRAGIKPASAPTPSWPTALYATPRVPTWSGPQHETFVAEDIVNGCRTAMQQFDLENLTSVGITSSIRGEGRTTIALAVALVLAEYGLDTVLLELDLEHPELAQRLAIPKSPGLADLAEGRAQLADTLRPIAAGLSVIPAGIVHSSIPRALRELATGGVIETLGAQGHVVVADMAPLVDNSAGRQAVSLVADLILVIRAGVVGTSSIKKAVDGLPVAPKVLLNGTHSNVPSWALRLSGV